MSLSARRLCLLSVVLLPLWGCQSGPGAASPAADAAGTPSRDAASMAPARPTAPSFAAWVADFRREAAAAGIDAATLAAAFDDATYLPEVIRRDRAQPEFSRRVWTYLDGAVSPARIRRGHDRWQAHRAVIEAAATRTGVPAPILVAIWGIESSYGEHFGDVSTIDALATLGYDGRRPDFARRELMAALRILARGDIDRAHMRGSWAGAMGHTQFLPSSFERHARDADGDGRRDIWGSIADVMASTADYLAEAGWRPGEPWGVEVRLPRGFDYARTELDVRAPAADWAERGVTAVDGGSLPALADASVIAPAGAQGPAFLVGHNFRVIMRYNASTSYALAVGLLADRLAGRPGVQGDWPREQAALSHDQIRLLQQALNARGFDTGTPDGVIGPATRGGVRAYQRARGVTPDGFVTRALLERLRPAP